MKYITYLVLLFAIGCVSCEESEIAPSEAQPNLFAPAESATDATSELRRQFFDETGCYLLFNDTLKNERIGTDAYGNSLYDTELLDLTYGINSSTQWKFVFSYMNDYEQQKEAVDVLRENILPALGEKFYPYSFLLIENMESYAYQVSEGEEEGRWNGPYEKNFFDGRRALAISVSALLADPEEFRNEIKLEYITKYVNNQDLTEFYSYGKEYYEQKYFTDEFFSEEEVWERTGVLSFYLNVEDLGGGDIISDLEIYSQASDLKEYINEILTKPEEEFKAEYEGFDIVLKKYDMLRKMILEGGFTIE